MKWFKKLRRWKSSYKEGKLKIYLTPLGKIIALGEIVLRKREEKNPTTDTSFRAQSTGTTEFFWYEQEDDERTLDR